jgi:uncharacterized protein YdeI (YjbR/CyaY-like superfamily)
MQNGERSTMKIPDQRLRFHSKDEWRSWLQDNHATMRDAWLVIRKSHAPQPGIDYDEAVEEALCFGWIDGAMKSATADFFYLRFSPRTKSSIWSMSNIHRVEKLIVEGKMTEAGQQKIEEDKASGAWDATIRREQVDLIPEELEIALRKIDGALARYQDLPNSRKKQYIYWLQTSKKDETKERRIQKIMEEILHS